MWDKHTASLGRLYADGHTQGRNFFLSARFVSTREIKLYMLLPISTAVTVHCLLCSASLLKRLYLCKGSRGCENWGEEEEIWTMWDWVCVYVCVFWQREKGEQERGGEWKNEIERKGELKWLKRSFWVERQVLLTFNSVCATWCWGYDANEEELKLARGLSLMDCSLAVLTLPSVHQKRLLCN